MSTDIQQTTWTADLHPPRWYWFLPLVLPLAAILFIVYQSTQVLPRLMVVPGFSLTDQTGGRLTSEALRGDLVIYAFDPANCLAPCRDSSQTLQQLRQALGASAVDGIPLHFVTVSSDKGTGSTQHLGTEAQSVGADPKFWHFVSASPEQFNTIFETNDAKHDVSPLYVLVDGWGIERAFYATAMPDLDSMETDLHSVAREARNSSGVNRYAYEAVHLFLCHNNIVETP